MRREAVAWPSRKTGLTGAGSQAGRYCANPIVGAAKVQKLGTGRNVPTRDEVRAVLERFGVEADGLPRG